MAQSDQVQNLVSNVTTPGGNGPRQLNSMSDLLAVTGWTSASASGGGGAGGQFEFTPDELRELIKEWKALGTELRAAHGTAQTLAEVQPPAEEPASEDFAAKAKQSGLAYLKHNQEMQDYVTDYIKKLQDTLDSYTNAEQANADQARRIQNRRG